MNTSEETVFAGLNLRLYIAGMSARSLKALETIRRICDQEFQGRYILDVVDIYVNPETARIDQIIAVPTLVRQEPKPIHVLIGDLSNEQKVRKLLGLPERLEPKAPAGV